MPTIETVKKSWGLVQKDARVILNDRVYVVKKVLADEGTFIEEATGRLVRLRLRKPKAKLIVADAEHDAAEARLNDSVKRAAGKAPRTPSPWETPPDDAEKTVREILGASIVAMSVDGEPMVCPPVDPSTIGSHLLLFHDVRIGGMTWEEASREHERMHKRGEMSEKHTHADRRPA